MVSPSTKVSPLLTRKLATPRKKRAPRSKLFPESLVQIALLDWLQLYNPSARKCIVRIMNEGKRTSKGHFLACRMGLHIGASDLFLAWPTLRYSGLWLEIKREKFKVTKSTLEHVNSQLHFIKLMKHMGYHADMGTGIDECIAIVKNYLQGN